MALGSGEGMFGDIALGGTRGIIRVRVFGALGVREWFRDQLSCLNGVGGHLTISAGTLHSLLSKNQASVSKYYLPIHSIIG